MPAIELVGISKRYRRHAGRPRATTFMSYVLRDFWRQRQSPKDHLWALKDVTLKVEEGVTMGLIGRNGSGKSTMLRLISRIHKPDSGYVTVNGTVAALIELGAGFHPDLSGRDNILINGIILGLTRNQIRGKFDEIVEFAELRDFIDEPVRTYSSGMQMRLGFSVATHVDPDILLLDEVFSVGDAAFRNKCIERMNQFKRMGKTIILVTHGLDLVRSWCDQAIWLSDGMLKAHGSPDQVVDAYTRSFQESG